MYNTVQYSTVHIYSTVHLYSRLLLPTRPPGFSLSVLFRRLLLHPSNPFWYCFGGWSDLFGGLCVPSAPGCCLYNIPGFPHLCINIFGSNLFLKSIFQIWAYSWPNTVVYLCLLYFYSINKQRLFNSLVNNFFMYYNKTI